MNYSYHLLNDSRPIALKGDDDSRLIPWGVKACLFFHPGVLI